MRWRFRCPGAAETCSSVISTSCALAAMISCLRQITSSRLGRAKSSTFWSDIGQHVARYTDTSVEDLELQVRRDPPKRTLSSQEYRSRTLRKNGLQKATTSSSHGLILNHGPHPEDRHESDLDVSFETPSRERGADSTAPRPSALCCGCSISQSIGKFDAFTRSVTDLR